MFVPSFIYKMIVMKNITIMISGKTQGFIPAVILTSGYEGSTEDLIPFINTDYFDFAYGDESAGERIIDTQMASTNIYVGTTMNGDESMFGVNFADGRIKGYPTGLIPGRIF